MSNKISNIQLRGWRQFKTLDIDFHPTLTVVTGPNGAGKSTVLGIVSRHFGYNRNMLATPRKRQRKKKSVSSLFSFDIFGWRGRSEKLSNQGQHTIGQVCYSNNVKAAIHIPNGGGSISYNLTIENQQPVDGLHVDSHRPPSVYQPVQNIPTTATTAQGMADALDGFFRQFYGGGFQSLRQNSLHHIKNSIISMAVFGYGNETIEPIDELAELFERFQEKLRIVLPPELGFERISVRTPDVVLETKSGQFVIDAASGGIIKIIEITWQIFFKSEVSKNFVVTMDEPENHLHPSMQRSFLKSFIEAFPDVQFIVASHSPFIVSSVRDSHVYVLRYTDDEFESVESVDVEPSSFLGRRVSSEKLDTVNKAGTAAEILRDVLGVPTTIPDWAHDRVLEIVSNFDKRSITPEVLDQMHDALRNEGLLSEYPRAASLLAGDPT